MVALTRSADSARLRIRSLFRRDLATDGDGPSETDLEHCLYEYRDGEAMRHVLRVASALDSIDAVTVPTRHPDEHFVASSIQFHLDHPNPAAVVAGAAELGVAIKWFGAPDPIGFTSRHDHWNYAPPRELDGTAEVLAGLCDMRIPLSMSIDDANSVAAIVEWATLEF